MSLEARDDLFSVLEEFESVFVEISDEWMKICFESNFTEFEQFSQFVRLSILGNIDVVALLIRLSGALLRFEKSAGENSTEIWEELSKRNMNAQKLVVLLWYLIERALIQNSALEEQKIGLCAAGAYLALCSLSASQAFNIFNAALYQKVLEILRIAYRLLTYDGVRNEGNRSRQGKASGAAKRKRTDDNLSALQNSTIVHLSGESKREVTEMLFDALDSLFALLDEVSLSASPEAVLGSVLLIRDLMTVDFSSNISVAASPCRRLSEFQSLRRFSERSFALMHRLIEPRHSSCAVLLGHIVMPRLVFWTFENTTLPASAHPTKLMNDYKDAMIRFIKFRIQKGDEDELSVIQRVLENVCHRCPDRSDYRTKVASTVCEILALMPLKYHYDFAHFIRVFGSVDRGAWRGFAVEMIPLLLLNFDFSSPDPSTQQNTTNGHGNIVVKTEPGEENANDREDDDGSVNQKKKKRKRPKKGSPVERQNPLVALVTVMVRSCNDKSSMVRSRAIVQMIDVLKNDRMRAFLSDISTEMAKLNLGEEESQENRVGVREESYADSPLLEMLLVRCNDSRVSVRKAAMQSVEAYCTCLNDRTLINLAVNAIKQGSHDTALSVRKQSAESLTHLLLSMSGNRAELSELLETSWLCSVMPLVVDREQSVVQLASRLINETMIQPIATNNNDLAWRLLAAVEQNLDYQRSLLRALMNEAKEGNLTERIVNVLWKKVDEVDKSTMAWMLIHELCAIFKIDPSRAVDVWFKRIDDEHRDTVMYVAHIIEAGADRLKAADKTKLRDDLSSKLREYRVDECHIPKIYWFFSRLYDCDDAELLNFNKRFLSDCSGRIHESIYGSERTFASSQNTSELTSSRLVRMIASIGEIVQCHPSLITEDLSELMQFIVASDVIREKVTQIVSRRQTPLPTQSQAGISNTNIHAVTEATNANRASSEAGPSQGTTTTQTSRPLSSQSTCHNTAGTTTTNAFVQSCFTNSDLFSSAVRARAVLTIGKMCLMDENLAKKCIPVFVKQLVKNPDHCVRNNIIVTVCDLCMRYTLLVDRYSSIIAMSLRDRSALVRKQALTLLTCLIKEQYIRWEGQIMYRFVSTLLDEDGGIREYAKMCLLDVLLVQFPKMFEHHFVECLFYFNRVRQGAWAIIKATDDEAECNQKNQCSLAGEKHREDRMKLYVFMLKTFNDESKFKLMERIGQEVFLAVTESSLDLSKTEVKYLLLDCYSVMCSGEIKLKHTLGSRGPNAAEDDEEEAPAAVQAGAKKVISQIFRKGIIEAVLPSVIQLRYYLQSKSEFCVYERGILLVLRELCKDHKEQLDEFLASDPTLKEEMRYDLKKLEEKEKAEAEAQQRLLMSKARSARRSAAMRLSSTPLTATRHPRAANQQQPVTPLASRPTSTIGHLMKTATQNTSERVASIVRNSLPATRKRQPLERVDEEEQPVADAVAAAAAAAAVTEEGSIQKGISDDEHGQPTATTDTADVQSSASEQPQTERQTHSPVQVPSSPPAVNAGQTASTSTPVASVSADRSAARKKSSILSEISPERIQRDSSAMNARAFSTPAHTMNELTFRLSDVSAILQSPPKKRTKNGRSTAIKMEKIDECEK